MKPKRHKRKKPRGRVGDADMHLGSRRLCVPSPRRCQICLGIPFAAGFLTRIGPITLAAPLCTAIAMFSLKGGDVLRLPRDAIGIAVPPVLYFAIQFAASFAMGRRIARDCPRIVAIALTAVGNSFWPSRSPSPSMGWPRPWPMPPFSVRWPECLC